MPFVYLITKLRVLAWIGACKQRGTEKQQVSERSKLVRQQMHQASPMNTTDAFTQRGHDIVGRSRATQGKSNPPRKATGITNTGLGGVGRNVLRQGPMYKVRPSLYFRPHPTQPQSNPTHAQSSAPSPSNHSRLRPPARAQLALAATVVLMTIYAVVFMAAQTRAPGGTQVLLILACAMIPPLAAVASFGVVSFFGMRSVPPARRSSQASALAEGSPDSPEIEVISRTGSRDLGGMPPAQMGQTAAGASTATF